MSENSNQVPATMSSIEQFSFFNPEQFETMQRVAKMFSSSELVPDMYQSSKVGDGKAISNTIIAIDIANRIQANILMVMQNLVIIYGRPSWSSKFLISTVNTCGKFKPLQYKFEDLGVLENYKYSEYESEWKQGQSGKKYKETKLVEKTFKGPVPNTQCICYTSAIGSDQILESSPISVRMAIDEGWYTKKGSKWPNMTKQMLMYRSAAFWTSAYAPELSMGMRTVEDVQDTIDIEHEDITDRKNKEEIIPQPEPVIPTDQSNSEDPIQEQPEPTEPAAPKKMKL